MPKASKRWDSRPYAATGLTDELETLSRLPVNEYLTPVKGTGMMAKRVARNVVNVNRLDEKAVFSSASARNDCRYHKRLSKSIAASCPN